MLSMSDERIHAEYAMFNLHCPHFSGLKHVVNLKREQSHVTTNVSCLLKV